MGFSEQLKKARLNKGYTQQQVADLMHISKSTYCGYETGKRQPDVKKIKQLSNILNTSGDILLETNLLHPNQNSVIDELTVDDDVKQLTKQYSLLTPEDQELVKKMINSLAEKIKNEKPKAD